MTDKMVKGILILMFIAAVHCGKWCYDNNNDDDDSDEGDHDNKTKSKYCSYGCCGTDHKQYCCNAEDDGNIGGTVGIIVGCLAAAALIAGISIAIWCCCYRKHRGTQGQVIAGTQKMTTTTIVGGGVYPLTSYTTATAPVYDGQPAMGYTNAAYPQMQMNAGYPQMDQAGMDQKWQQPPPSYDNVNPTKT